MTVSPTFFTLLESFEGFKECPYLDSGNVPTIGIGSTHYPTGVKVRMTDPCIKHDRALIYAQSDVHSTEDVINSQLHTINQNQFDSLVSFTYNVGEEALLNSTLLRKAKADPKDPTIRNEFMKWVMVKGKPSSDLRERRTKEANLYFQSVT